VLVPSYSLYIM